MEETELGDIGVVGMAVMGSNLARNLAHHGFTVALYNRTWEKTEAVVAQYGREGKFLASATLAEFVARLAKPRRIILMVRAGRPTDAVISELMDYLDPGDIIVDGGNSFFADTRRREAEVGARGFHFVGVGISGGEHGALTGPSIMVGGAPEAYRSLGPLLEAISAQVDHEPCCSWLGPDGAGHFVKMIHNGIEYSDMQVIGEAYQLLRGVGLSNQAAAAVFAEWNRGDLDSYLIEITAAVLAQTDPRTGADLIDVIKDRAQMKGTGTWTVQTALDLGTPVDGIAAAVFARAVSSHDELRRVGRDTLSGPNGEIATADREGFVEDVHRALWCAKVVSYAQGFDLIRTGGAKYGWDIDVAECAKIWRAGCIIRAKLLERIRAEYAADPKLVSLLCAPSVAPTLIGYQDQWRRVVATAVTAGIPTPVFASTLAYFDSVRSERLNAALTQGMRDYFGSHTYERIDAPGHFHLEWSRDHSETRL